MMRQFSLRNQGWVEDSTGLLYYPELGKSFSIFVSMQASEVILWGGADFYGPSTRHELPDHINNAEEAKAWALAVWRMR